MPCSRCSAPTRSSQVLAQPWGTRLARVLLAKRLEATEEGQRAEKGFAEVPVSFPRSTAFQFLEKTAAAVQTHQACFKAEHFTCFKTLHVKRPLLDCCPVVMRITPLDMSSVNKVCTRAGAGVHVQCWQHAAYATRALHHLDTRWAHRTCPLVASRSQMTLSSSSTVKRRCCKFPL